MEDVDEDEDTSEAVWERDDNSSGEVFERLTDYSQEKEVSGTCRFSWNVLLKEGKNEKIRRRRRRRERRKNIYLKKKKRGEKEEKKRRKKWKNDTN